MVDERASRDALSDLISRYAQTIDSGDVTAVLECFSDDAVLEYSGGQIVLKSKAEARTFFENALLGPSTHQLTNLLYEQSSEDAATVRCSGVAHLTWYEGKITARGLQYTFRCVRDASGWRIAHLQHRAIWQFEVPGGPITA